MSVMAYCQNIIKLLLKTKRGEIVNFAIVGLAAFFELVIALSCLVVWYKDTLVPVLGAKRLAMLLWRSCWMSIFVSLFFFAAVSLVYTLGGRKRYWHVPLLLAIALCTTSSIYLSEKVFLNFTEAGTIQCVRVTVLWCDTLLLAFISAVSLLFVTPGLRANICEGSAPKIDAQDRGNQL